MADWNKRFIGQAFNAASWSKDRSTKVGAVIVDDKQSILCMGYNGFPRGCDDNKDERHERPAKYLYTEHAERNAVYNGARNGVKLDGSTIYSTLFPCADCARAIIQCGIKKVVTFKPNLEHPVWKESFTVSLEMFNEVGIEIEYLEKEENQ